MGLATNSPVGFIPTTKPEAARAFYEKTLGLRFESADDFAIVFRLGPAGIMLRVTMAPEFTPNPFTIFGWQVDDIVAIVTELAAKGVEFTALRLHGTGRSRHLERARRNEGRVVQGS